MKQVAKIFMFLAVAAVTVNCTNKELEKRIAKLEGKVAELENKNSPRPSASSSGPKITPVKDVEPDGPVPEFEFEEESFDFGTINEGDIVTHVFEFTNTGEAPLIISNASASCGCTVPEWPKEPIPVGGTGNIKVQFNSRNKPGIQNKTVSITANTYPKLTRLRIKANVTKNNPS